jgi:hypothetical protein
MKRLFALLLVVSLASCTSPLSPGFYRFRDSNPRTANHVINFGWRAVCNSEADLTRLDALAMQDTLAASRKSDEFFPPDNPKADALMSLKQLNAANRADFRSFQRGGVACWEAGTADLVEVIPGGDADHVRVRYCSVLAVLPAAVLLPVYGKPPAVILQACRSAGYLASGWADAEMLKPYR